jgi:hypothetical protein
VTIAGAALRVAVFAAVMGDVAVALAGRERVFAGVMGAVAVALDGRGAGREAGGMRGAVTGVFTEAAQCTVQGSPVRDLSCSSMTVV